MIFIWNIMVKQKSYSYSEEIEIQSNSQKCSNNSNEK